MNHCERVQARGIPSVPTLIAWLSVCLLAAAAGHALDQRWQPLWARIGAFGLAAAVGLSTVESARDVRERRRHERRMRARAEGGLARVNQHTAAVDSINEALGRLTAHALRQRRGKPLKSTMGTRSQAGQLLAGYPIEIMAIDEQSPTQAFENGRNMIGSVRQFSSRAVTFEHASPLDSPMALLTFKLGTGDEQLSFVVDIMWTERADQGFASGGTVLAAGVPNRQQGDGEGDMELAISASS